MGASFFIGMSIERIDNAKGYSPDNCKWIPKAHQAKNRHTTRFITYNGKTLSMRDWERELGYKNGTIKARIQRYGWSVERALTT